MGLAVTFTKNEAGAGNTYDSVGASMTTLHQRSCSSTSCTLDSHGTEIELAEGRSAQGYDAGYIDTSTLPQADVFSMATNTGMVMKTLSPGTYTFTVKGKFTVRDGKAGSPGPYANAAGLLTDPTDTSRQSVEFDHRALQVIVLGSGNSA